MHQSMETFFGRPQQSLDIYNRLRFLNHTVQSIKNENSEPACFDYHFFCLTLQRRYTHAEGRLCEEPRRHTARCPLFLLYRQYQKSKNTNYNGNLSYPGRVQQKDGGAGCPRGTAPGYQTRHSRSPRQKATCRKMPNMTRPKRHRVCLK